MYAHLPCCALHSAIFPPTPGVRAKIKSVSQSSNQNKHKHNPQCCSTSPVGRCFCCCCCVLVCVMRVRLMLRLDVATCMFRGWVWVWVFFLHVPCLVLITPFVCVGLICICAVVRFSLQCCFVSVSTSCYLLRQDMAFRFLRGFV
jgi:hypothetical protein